MCNVPTMCCSAMSHRRLGNCLKVTIFLWDLLSTGNPFLVFMCPADMRLDSSGHQHLLEQHLIAYFWLILSLHFMITPYVPVCSTTALPVISQFLLYILKSYSYLSECLVSHPSLVSLADYKSALHSIHQVINGADSIHLEFNIHWVKWTESSRGISATLLVKAHTKIQGPLPRRTASISLRWAQTKALSFLLPPSTPSLGCPGGKKNWLMPIAVLATSCPTVINENRGSVQGGLK